MSLIYQACWGFPTSGFAIRCLFFRQYKAITAMGSSGLSMSTSRKAPSNNGNIVLFRYSVSDKGFSSFTGCFGNYSSAPFSIFSIS